MFKIKYYSKYFISIFFKFNIIKNILTKYIIFKIANQK